MDIMHAILLNITPMLFRLWNAELLDLDTIADSRSDYVIPSELEKIGRAMAEARRDIPASLGHAPRNIATYYRSFKAAEWKGWLLLYGVPLLTQNLGSNYVANFRTLSRIFYRATQPSIHDINEIRRLCIKFVRGFETLYYRCEASRISVCRINTHFLLHLADYVQDCGPACYWWQYTMERFCGIIKPMARSKSQLNSSLTNALIKAELINHARFTMLLPNPTATPQHSLGLLDQFDYKLTRQQRVMLRELARQHYVERQIPQFNIVDGYRRFQMKEGMVVGSRYTHSSAITA